MKKLDVLRLVLLGGACSASLATAAQAESFNIPGGDLYSALKVYSTQSGIAVVVSDAAMKGAHTRGVKGTLSSDAALSQILRGTGFVSNRDPSGVVDIVRNLPDMPSVQPDRAAPVRMAAAAAAGIESVIVTSSKIRGDIQTVPIAITALSQEQLTSRQIAGGPDLIKEVPNLTFSKTNFSGYNIEIRGIGTQAISVTTDPAVAVVFNDIPFIRNHFFEQEFYDLENVEVLRGPQGTLYGRNATAGVVNVESAKPSDQYEAVLSADWGNYLNRRYEGMVNIPIVGDTLDIRAAAEWTKRNGYSINDVTNQPIDGRDLWSSRVTIGWKPTSDIQTYLVWEHFQENDDRIRSGKQLCTPIQRPDTFDGLPVGYPYVGSSQGDFLTQGCGDGSLYSPAAFGVPNAESLPFVLGLNVTEGFLREPGGYPPGNGYANAFIDAHENVYAGTTQSTNLRVTSSELNPAYRAKNDTLEYNADWRVTPSLTFSSQTGYNQDFLWSTEDYNRFTTVPHAYDFGSPHSMADGINSGNGTFCDPQLGCSDRLVAEDLSDEHAWQLSQEFRLASNFSGPLNFSIGGNYLHYETEENYYVFVNALTLIALAPDYGGLGSYTNYSGAPIAPYQSGMTDNSFCLAQPHQLAIGGGGAQLCSYIDPNPLGSLNNKGHNYFLSQNPYVLNSYAGFGEAYYSVTNDFKLTAGARWTEDRKHFINIPSEVLTYGYGYPVAGVTNQQWDVWTGRFVADWTPDLSFTDKTLIYGSVSHGYKAGGANPPGAELLTYYAGDIANPIHPTTFKPEYIEAFELGTKNTLLDDSLTLNGDAFYYNYSGYQISRIVDRTAINDNFNATVRGAELELNWEAAPGLKFSFAGGYEDAVLDNGQQSVDLMDRTAGIPGWSVVRPFITQASNCILPDYVIFTALNGSAGNSTLETACGTAYAQHFDPVTGTSYVANPPGYIENAQGDTYIGGQLVTICPGSIGCGVQYPGFDPLTAPNNGQGFDKNLSGHQLPNAPHFTASLTGEYTMPVSEDWAATLHADFYWQSQQWARVFMDPIDKIRPYSTTNLSLILTSANGWQVMGYVKNVFNVTSITGTFLNSDDTDLTTNIFLTDPRLFGIRVTKHFDQGVAFWGSSSGDTGKPPLWIEFGGQFDLLNDDRQKIDPPFFAKVADAGFTSPLSFEKSPKTGMEKSAKVSFTPDDGNWVLSASVRYGRNGSKAYKHEQTNNIFPGIAHYNPMGARHRYAETTTSDTETHEIFDFMAGKDIGLGGIGLNGTSVLSGGVRFVQFRSKSAMAVYADPDYSNIFPANLFTGPGPKYIHNYSAKAKNKTSFTGVGPSISWGASTPVSGDAQDGQITFDWSANGAVVFGRQKSTGYHETKGKLSTGLINVPQFGKYYRTSHYTHGGPHNRSRKLTVPNLGATAAFSFKYQNARVSFGYRIDEFFGAMDGGIDQHKSYNFGDSGPFANITLGLGG